MNERIRELAAQAGFYVAGSKIYIPSTSEDITTCQTKFAELIVRECAELMYGRDENGNCKDGDVIKKHFGVEE